MALCPHTESAGHLRHASRAEIIPGTTHFMFEQNPVLYCELVLDFLDIQRGVAPR